MVRDDNVTNYERSDAELEEFLLFAICVAGKNSDQQAKKLERLLRGLEILFTPSDSDDSMAIRVLQDKLGYQYSISPFQLLRYVIDEGHWSRAKGKREDYLDMLLRSVAMGKYVLLGRAFREVLTLQPRTATLEELEAVHGIGAKTARFFLMHTRKGARVAALDTHILKAMALWGYKVPRATPSKKRYLELEQIFLLEARGRRMTPADLDLTLWLHFAGRREAPARLLRRQRSAQRG